MESVNNCLLCGQKTFNLLFSATDRLNITNESFALIKCDHCALVFVSPRPEEKEIGSYYPSMYWGGGKGVLSSLIEHARNFNKRRVMMPDVKKLLSYKKKGTVLDIGCSQGFFLKFCKDEGLEPFGVEMSPEARAFARQKLDLNYMYEDFDSACFTEKSLDAVTLWSVLEHFHHPDKVLQQVRGILKDDGVLIIQVPNIESAQAKKYGNRWGGIDAPRHLYHFSPATLTKLLEKEGFQVIRESHFYNRHNLSFKVVSAFSLDEHNAGMKGKLLSFAGIQLLKILLYPLVMIENMTRKGATFYVVCRKRF